MSRDTSPPPPPNSSQPLTSDDPREVGPYVLLGRLGRGGMGVVYLGRSADGALAAVKIILPELAADQSFRRRFGREIESAMRVRSRFTARVLAADAEAEQPWLATEFVPDPPLNRRVGPHAALPEADVRTVVDGTAQALRAIHAVGLVHRDIKPGNILYGTGDPCVIDMGIARSVDDTALTQTGRNVGTVGYQAPEQLRTGTFSSAVDIWGLGLVAFVCATGEWPYAGEIGSMGHLLSDEQPDLGHCPDYLRPLVQACLASDPTARPTAEDIVAANGDWTRLGPRVSLEADTEVRPTSSSTGAADVAGDTPAPHQAQTHPETEAPTGARRYRVIAAVVAAIAVLATAVVVFAVTRGSTPDTVAVDPARSGSSSSAGASAGSSASGNGRNVPDGAISLGGESASGRPSAPSSADEASSGAKTFDVGTVTISGRAKYGTRLTAAASGWAPAPTSATCVWYRDNSRLSTDGSCAYTVQTGDIDHRIKAVLTGRASGYRAADRSSAYTSTVTKPWLDVPVPTLSGTARVGRSVTCSTTEQSGVTYRIKFYRRTDSGPVQFGGTREKATPRSSATVPKKAQGREIYCTIHGIKTGYKSQARESDTRGPVRAA
ncbi:serine/threonine protein kinase [Nocardioides albertanoniae]|uniref:Serine/threonine protein kinase n=1 Tax=Nocardioides albertanoniae TaxID=1175486 RepID=A0A543ADZ3_9ACTN|nr:serine/threonine-protein kinase [Nocardioides albertanoniae]TQL70802.1 serine/threonine protein kinase [Nocardioides albertanoniae]